PKEVIRTTGAERGKILGPLAAGKEQCVFLVCVMGDHSPIGRKRATERRQHARRNLLAVGQGSVLEAAKRGRLLLPMLQYELTHLIDGPNVVGVALPRRIPPGEQAVTGKDQPVTTWIFLDGAFQLKRQFKSGALPRQPCDVASEPAIELLQFSFS